VVSGTCAKGRRAMKTISSRWLRVQPRVAHRVGPFDPRRRISWMLCAALTLATSSAFAQSGGGYAITRRSVGFAGATFQNGGGYRLGSTIGRSDSGDSSGGGYDLLGGFWVRNIQPVILEWDSDPLSPLRGTRSITFTASPPVVATGLPPVQAAIRIDLLDLQTPIPPNELCCPAPDFSAYESASCTAAGESNACTRWVGPPVTIQESQDVPALGIFLAARLQCTPYYTDWTAFASVTIFGAEILPSSTYELVTFASSCKGIETTCINIGIPVQALTRRSGDVVTLYNPPSLTAQPDGNDVIALVNKFKNLAGAPSKASGQIFGNVVELNLDVSGLDISAAVDAFKGLAYPNSGPCACPSVVTCNATPCAGAASCPGGPCVKTCVGGVNLNQPCLTNAHCPSSTCGTGFCRDRCGRCRD